MATGRKREKKGSTMKMQNNCRKNKSFHVGLGTERNEQSTKKLRYLLLQSFLPGVLANP